MKTGVIIGFLIFLCGALMLVSDGGLSIRMNPSLTDSAFIRSIAATGHLWVMSPAFGWFVVGTGAVLLGLKLQERKRVR